MERKEKLVRVEKVGKVGKECIVIPAEAGILCGLEDWEVLVRASRL